MKTCFRLAVCLLLAAPLVAVADDGSWKLPNLNPFSQKSKAATPRKAQPPTSGWHMPSLWPKTQAAQPKPNQPSSWQKMTTGTKSVFSKTADALNPWDNNKQPASPPKPSGSNSAFSQASAKKKQSQDTSLLPSWPWGTKKEEPPKDVNDFLSRPRPGF